VYQYKALICLTMPKRNTVRILLFMRYEMKPDQPAPAAARARVA
jgi:hypothetical protein